MDQFLIEVLGEEWRRNHRPNAGRCVSGVREQRSADERPGIAGAGHDEVSDLTRAHAVGCRAYRAGMRWRNDLDCRDIGHDGAPLQLPTHCILVKNFCMST